MNRGEKVRVFCLIVAAILLAVSTVAISAANGETIEKSQASIRTITAERDSYRFFTISSLIVTVIGLIAVVVLYFKYRNEVKSRDYESEQYEKKSNEKLDKIYALNGEVENLKMKLETTKTVHEKEVKQLNDEITRLKREISMRVDLSKKLEN